MDTLLSKHICNYRIYFQEGKSCYQVLYSPSVYTKDYGHPVNKVDYGHSVK